MDYNISFYLDKRFIRTDKTYSVKLRVYSNLIKKSKLFSTKKSLTEEDFERFVSSKNLRGSKKDIQLELEALKVHAEGIAKKLEPFTFEKFERRMYSKKNASINILHHYQNKIEILRKNEQLYQFLYDITVIFCIFIYAKKDNYYSKRERKRITLSIN